MTVTQDTRDAIVAWLNDDVYDSASDDLRHANGQEVAYDLDVDGLTACFTLWWDADEGGAYAGATFTLRRDDEVLLSVDDLPPLPGTGVDAYFDQITRTILPKLGAE